LSGNRDGEVAEKSLWGYLWASEGIKMRSAVERGNRFSTL
jgi:hypothetical protein